MLLRSTAALLVAAACAWAATAADARVFDPHTFTLGNGLQVVVVSDHRVPVVSHMIWYKVGAADEPLGQSGIAHLLEHLMFKGTPTVPQGEFSRRVARQGGQENAFTSYDYTGYFQNIAADRLEMVMRLEADRMTNLTLTEAQIAPEKLVVLEERRQRVDNDPASVLAEEAQAARYLNHPYRRPIIGWEHEIAALSVESVLAFYRRWYAPENGIVVISGDVTVDQVRPLAERTYGRVPRGTGGSRPDLQEPPPRADRRVTLTDNRVRQPTWTRSWPAPSYGTRTADGDAPDVYALQVLAEILGGSATSRLYRSLVVERPLANAAGAWYDPSRRGPSLLMIYATPRPQVSLAQIEAEIDALVRAWREQGISEEDVTRAKQRMTAEAIYARDHYATASRQLGEALAVGQSITDVEAWPDRIAAVDRARVNAAARIVFDRPSVTSLLAGTDKAGTATDDGPAAGSPAGLPAGVGAGIR